MADVEKTKNGSKRRVPWLLLLVVVLIGLLLWWWSRVRPPVKVAEAPRIEQPLLASLGSSDSHSESNRDLQPINHQNRKTSAAEIEISGRVVLIGKPPKEQRLVSEQNPDKSVTTTFSRNYEVSASGGLANVFVYVQTGLEGKTFARPDGVLRLTGTNWFMEPYMLGARVNQSVEIETPGHRHSHEFQMVSSRGDEFAWERDSDERLPKTPLELVFSGPDVLSRLVCKEHTWEWAYFGVVEHPYFAVTDKDGYFKLPKGIPPGAYTIAVQHPKAGEAIQSVTAVQGGKYNLSFRLKVPKVDPTLLDPAPVTQTEGESLEENLSSNGGTVAGRTTQDGFSEGAPIIGNDSIAPGIIRGQVRLRGTPTPEKPVDVIKNDPNCGRLIHDTPSTRFYVTGDYAGLADTVVYIEAESLPKGMTFPPRTEPLLLDQVNCEYTPYIAALQTGQKMFVRNSDPLLHNVHPTPTAPGNREANKAQMPKAPDLEFVFENPEPFLRFKCDVHPWMFSYVSVFDHPFFAVSDANGNFSITNVPPGKYRLQAMHRKAGTVSQEVVLTRGRGSEITFALDAK